MSNTQVSLKRDFLGMITAPWIYINDPTSESRHSNGLAALMPDVLHRDISSGEHVLPKRPNGVVLFTDRKSDHDDCPKTEAVKNLKATAIKAGANFVSINIMDDLTRVSAFDNLDTNHLDIADGPGVAEKIYKWLFSVLTVRETLHLISKEQMKKTDDKHFLDYEYRPINESKSRPKDAKIQFVALILTKPQIIGGQKLTWSVADHSGVASFYFQYRDSRSQCTWDWCLSLKPGDRRVLPRMPMTEIREKKRIRLVKAPCRATAAMVGGTGCAIRAAGISLCKVGKAMRMGSSREWVAEADVGTDGKKLDWTKVNRELKVVEPSLKKIGDVSDEKGDGVSVASTDIGSEYDEKAGKEFV